MTGATEVLRDALDVLDDRCSPRVREEADAALADLDALVQAVEHVVADSPGTPDSVKGYLRFALARVKGDAA